MSLRGKDRGTELTPPVNVRREVPDPVLKQWTCKYASESPLYPTQLAETKSSKNE